MTYYSHLCLVYQGLDVPGTECWLVGAINNREEVVLVSLFLSSVSVSGGCSPDVYLQLPVLVGLALSEEVERELV